MMLACGMPESVRQGYLAKRQGLVPAIFYAGARSVVRFLWPIKIDDGCQWVKAVESAWGGA